MPFMPARLSSPFALMVTALVAIGAGYAVRLVPSPSRQDLLKPAREAPRVSLADTRGQIVRTEPQSGKGTILNFMATWCAPCIAELPLLATLAEPEYESRLALISIVVDDSPARVRSFEVRNHIRYPLLLDRDGTA